MLAYTTLLELISLPALTVNHPSISPYLSALPPLSFLVDQFHLELLLAIGNGLIRSSVKHELFAWMSHISSLLPYRPLLFYSFRYHPEVKS